MNFLLKVSLFLSMVGVLVLSFRTLQRVKMPSLLVIHILLFVIVFNPAAFFIDPIVSIVEFFPPTFDPVVEERILACLIIVNLVASGVLFFLLNYTSRHESQMMAYRTSPGMLIWNPERMVPIILMTLMGLAIYAASGQLQFVVANTQAVLGDYSSYYNLRAEVSQAEMASTTRYAIIVSLYVGFPILTLFSLNKAIQSKNIWMYIPWLLCLASWTILSLSLLQKSPVITVVISNIAAGVLFSILHKFQVKKILVIGTVGFVLLLLIADLIYRMLGASSTIEFSLLLLYERLVEVPLVTVYYHYEVFPDVHPHTHYSLSRTLNLLLGFGQYVETQGLASWQMAAYYTCGIVFNMNSGFLGAGWAEFGYLGVFQCALIIFGLCAFWDIVFIKKALKAPHYLLATYFIGRFMNIHNTELMYMLLPGGFLLAPLTCLFLWAAPPDQRFRN